MGSEGGREHSEDQYGGRNLHTPLATCCELTVQQVVGVISSRRMGDIGSSQVYGSEQIPFADARRGRRGQQPGSTSLFRPPCRRFRTGSGGGTSHLSLTLPILIPDMGRTLIMSPARVRRTLRRLAYEIVERNQGADAIELFGIRESGVPLAQTIAEEISAIEETELGAYDLDVTPFRDDHPELDPPETPPHDVDVTDRDVVLVDDVLFTGRTVRAALDAVLQYGRPRSIQLVVLIDRGHREYPIQPDCTGRLLQTKHREEVVVDTEGDFAVYVED